MTSALIKSSTSLKRSLLPTSIATTVTAGSPLSICSRITVPISLPRAGQLSTLSPVRVTTCPVILTSAMYESSSNFWAKGALSVSESRLKVTEDLERTSPSNTNLHLCGSAVGSPRILTAVCANMLFSASGSLIKVVID